MSVSKPVVSKAEVQYYHELGLGRGVNVTHPDMWRSKTPNQVRRASPDVKNIIGTRECGVLESYETEVSTFSMHKQKLRLSLQNPTAPVKLGIDEQYSRSSSSTKLIKGKKIEKRTISFKSQFDEVPLYKSIDEADIAAPKCFLNEDKDHRFEESVAAWLIKRIHDREKKAKGDNSIDKTADIGSNPIKELAMKLQKLDEEDRKKEKAGKWQFDMLEDCITLIEYLDITHYVSAIKLGASEYSVVTTRTEQKTLGVGTSVAVKSLVEGGLSGEYDKRMFHKSQKQQKIGRIEKENVTDEAVIGFDIQPLYKLVRIQFIQMMLRRAVIDYIHSKEDTSSKQGLADHTHIIIGLLLRCWHNK